MCITASCATTPSAGDERVSPTPVASAPSTADNYLELHPAIPPLNDPLSEDDWRQPLTIAARFLQRLLAPVVDDDARRYATERLRTELSNGTSTALATSTDTEGKPMVSSVRIVRAYEDWATALAIVDKPVGRVKNATPDNLDLYFLTLARQADGHWLVAGVTLR